MEIFALPDRIRKHCFSYDPENLPMEVVEKIRVKLQRFDDQKPLVSIVIPAFNEETSILNTLSSLADLKTVFRVELIVANNNSKDKTQGILDACGVKSLLIENQGISYARQGGLDAAKGKIVLNADADSIYPPFWLDYMVAPLLKSKEISCVYGAYSFIPSKGNSRMGLLMYEVVSSGFFKLKRINRECVNVMGFNFAFRKDEAIQIGGFKHCLDRASTGRCEDGWMALELQKVGKLFFVQNNISKVWTSDRRLMADGSIVKAFQNRVFKEMRRLNVYWEPNP
jgi:glycosyltransferase involved in cell wall biosynthesis